jgi:predicted Zn-dependent protease
MSWLVHLVVTLVSAAWLWSGPVGDGVVLEVDGAAGEAEGVATLRAGEPRPPLVVVRALGPVPSHLLRTPCRVLLAEHDVRCVIRGGLSITEVLGAWDVDRAQLDARRALDASFEARSSDAVFELHVTALDLYEARKPYVFGLASMPDRTAIVSLSRLEDDAPGREQERLRTLVLHEFGHAVGLAHHDVEDCVMRQDPTVASLDEAPDGPCVACRLGIERRLETLGRPGQTALDRARGLLVRDRRDEARRTLVAALRAHPPDVELLDAFGRLFYEAGEYDEAIALLRHAVARDPARAAAYVQLGLAYRHRGDVGDLARAVGSFEQALELRPDWERVQEHLAVTRAELSAQGP